MAYASYLVRYLPEKLFVGCKLLGGTPGADGTSPLNSGLFVRRTLREMMHGYNDPLFAAVPAGVAPPGMTLEYNGLLGKYSAAAISLGDVRAAFATGATNASAWSQEFDAGVGDIANVNKWVSYKGVSVEDAGTKGYPGWGTNGTVGSPFVTTGLHYQNNQAPSQDTPSPWSMVTSSFKKIRPAFGKSISFYLTAIHRPVTIGCGADGSAPPGECGYHEVKGIQTFRFAPSNHLLQLTVGGAPSADCAASRTCDWLMRHEGVINLAVAKGAPLAVTMGYLGRTASGLRDAVSITRATNPAEEVHFDEAADGLALFLEPITGAAIRGQERLQTNFYIEKAFLSSGLYSNLFTTNETFVWPYMFLERLAELDDDQASSFKGALYRAYRIGFAVDILALVLFLLGIVCTTLYCAMRVRAANKGGMPTPGPTAESKSEGTQV
jgi:hypothetical protein